ncbi:MAG: ATP-dependent protease [Deltaproteobacteria bacterium]|nr:MAG: ATP-dependent protease [Deltaproteobacteria bacterium]
MLARTLSSAVIGIDAHVIEVEVDIASGLPAFTIVGLPEAAVKESKERVKSAIVNAGYRFPADRITVNLAPAHIKKDGTGFDLPIAMGILAATDLLPRNALSRYLMMGELSLDGRIKPVNGILPMAVAARDMGYRGIVVPPENGTEAAAVEGIRVLPAPALPDVVAYFRGTGMLMPQPYLGGAAVSTPADQGICFSEVRGQEYAKRAMEVAAAGGHNLFMTGPPGSGKSMLARRLSTILPPMDFHEAMETTKVYSVCGMLPPGVSLLTARPFRAPHHTISDAGLIGGGHNPRPGEVSLAHNGVLFLDELPEFKRPVLEAMRQPLEDREVTISRAMTTITYPASVMLIGASNPCICGYYGDPRNTCRCTAAQIRRYQSRLSGPLMDRFDIQIAVPAVDTKDLMQIGDGELSSAIRDRVVDARERQAHRFAGTDVRCNARMDARHITHFCPLDDAGSSLLTSAIERLGLSARAYNRILKIARTLADLAGTESITAAHVAEAVQYRDRDRSDTPF